MNLFSGGNGDTYTTWGGQADNGSENTVYSYNDDFTWIKGAHTFKFGGQCQINHYNGFGRQCESGCVGFSYTETGVPGVTDPNQGGNAFASFLLGYADSGSDRYAPLYRPAVPLFRWLCTGRLACESQTGAESGLSLGNQLASNWTEQ